VAGFVNAYNHLFQIYYIPTPTYLLDQGKTNVICLDVDAKKTLSYDCSHSEYVDWAWSTLNNIEYNYHLRPQLAVNSGFGLHLYYYLREPIYFEDAKLLYSKFPIEWKDDGAKIDQNSYWRGFPLTYNHSYDPPRLRTIFYGTSKTIGVRYYDYEELVYKIETNPPKSVPYISISIRDKPKIECDCETATDINDWKDVIEKYCNYNYWLNKVFYDVYFLSIKKQGLTERYKKRGKNKGPRHDRSWCENTLLYAMVEAGVPEKYYLSILTNWRYGRGKGPGNYKWRLGWVKCEIPKARIYAFLKLNQSYCSLKKIARNTGYPEAYVESVCSNDFSDKLKSKFIRKNKRRQLCFKFIKLKKDKASNYR